MGQSDRYLSLAREIILSGERVIQSIYQPAIRQRIASVLGHEITRPFSPAHLTILTDQEVILIEDAESIAENKRSKYGGVWHFLPLRSLVLAEVGEGTKNLSRLTFRTSGGVQVEQQFEGGQREEIEAMIATLETRDRAKV